MTEQSPDAILEDVLNGRHSCRGFRPDPVPRRLITRTLALAQRSASWCNVQPWHVTVVSGAPLEELRNALFRRASEGEEISDVPFPPRYEGVFLQRRRECGKQLYESTGVPRGDRAAATREKLKNFRLFDAPHVALIQTEKNLGSYALLDCGIYVANFMNAAQSLGLATIPQAALAECSELLRSWFQWPQERQFLCAISFGYEDTAAAANGFRTPRAPLDEAVTMIG